MGGDAFQFQAHGCVHQRGCRPDRTNRITSAELGAMLIQAHVGPHHPVIVSLKHPHLSMLVSKFINDCACIQNLLDLEL